MPSPLSKAWAAHYAALREHLSVEEASRESLRALDPEATLVRVGLGYWKACFKGVSTDGHSALDAAEQAVLHAA